MQKDWVEILRKVNFDTKPKIIQIDSRVVQPGDIFVAIIGEAFDGHDFVKQAIEKGAVFAIVSKKLPEWELENGESKGNLIFVEDTKIALGELAKLHRNNINLPVVGITGSSGKTTLKEFCASICSQRGKTHKTQGNQNNEIGLPLTLLALEPAHEFAIIEMGARNVKDIAYLCELAKPNIGIVNNIGTAHIEIFGSRDNIASTKGEMYEALANNTNNIAIVNRDDDYFEYFVKNLIRTPFITFGLQAGCDYFATDIVLEPLYSRFILHTPFGKANVCLNIPGIHNIYNALAASSMGGALGFSIEETVAGLENFQTAPGRLQVKKHNSGAIVIDDTYNANPQSVMAAIDVLAEAKSEKILILGDMGELGNDAIVFHEKIGQYAKEKKIDKLFTIGKLSKTAAIAFGSNANSFNTKTDLVEVLKNILTPTTTVLIKGSRSAAMDTVVSILLNTKEETTCSIG